MSICSRGPEAESLTVAVRWSAPLDEGRKMHSPTGAEARKEATCSAVPFLKLGWPIRRCDKKKKHGDSSAPPTPLLYAIYHTILVMAIFCEGHTWGGPCTAVPFLKLGWPMRGCEKEKKKKKGNSSACAVSYNIQSMWGWGGVGLLGGAVLDEGGGRSEAVMGGKKLTHTKKTTTTQPTTRKEKQHRN